MIKSIKPAGYYYNVYQMKIYKVTYRLHYEDRTVRLVTESSLYYQITVRL